MCSNWICWTNFRIWKLNILFAPFVRHRTQAHTHTHAANECKQNIEWWIIIVFAVCRRISIERRFEMNDYKYIDVFLLLLLLVVASNIVYWWFSFHFLPFNLPLNCTMNDGMTKKTRNSSATLKTIKNINLGCIFNAWALSRAFIFDSLSNVMVDEVRIACRGWNIFTSIAI